MNRVALILAALLAALLLQAPSFAKPRRITILAPFTCAEWSKSQEKLRTVQPGFALPSYAHRHWLLGLLTGLNANGAARDDLLASVDSQLAFDWMDRYCTANPAADVFEAANVFLGEIVKRGGAAAPR
jgi:hypothetical protein